jgi:2-polyprenyl-6-methoxyphenol hydroxylase-like FAD-dependent oxidoreductase
MWHGGKRFIFARLTNSTVCWLAILPGKPDVPERAGASAEEVQKYFSHFHPVVKDIIQSTSSLIQNDIADLPPHHHPWFYKRNIFLGDSIHATTPNLAQGGCQAIEDAYCLSLLFKKYDVNCHEVGKHYWRLRKERAKYVVANSWRYGKMIHQPWQAYLLRQFLSLAPESFFYNQEDKLNNISYMDGLL